MAILKKRYEPLRTKNRHAEAAAVCLRNSRSGGRDSKTGIIRFKCWAPRLLRRVVFWLQTSVSEALAASTFTLQVRSVGKLMGYVGVRWGIRPRRWGGDDDDKISQNYCAFRTTVTVLKRILIYTVSAHSDSRLSKCAETDKYWHPQCLLQTQRGCCFLTRAGPVSCRNHIVCKLEGFYNTAWKERGQGSVAGFCEHSNELWIVIKGGNLLPSWATTGFVRSLLREVSW
jgi:hypothetical protein